MYSIDKNANENAPKFNLKKYPSGRRLSPAGGCGEVNRSQMCYIPTDEEARGEEIMSLAEGVRRPSRVSISIDVGTQQYSVFRNMLERRIEEEKQECDNAASDCCQRYVRRRKSSLRRKISARLPTQYHHTSTSISPRAHSAPNCCRETMSTNSDASTFTTEHSGTERKLCRRIKEMKKMKPIRSPIASSSNISMEYDDLFEMYSDEDYNRNYTLNPITTVSSTTKLDSESGCSFANPLRRKDLEFDDPVVLAVPETAKDSQEVASPMSEQSESNPPEELQEV
ncbi:hypothetical protein GCK32_013636 [Trichostrongylus colubriformis]|uniref:Uncharacterized protein n=1 Tax=Trichostrongylus colubriformis TaxID=6319 RepID=A0AAN8FG93_TRICO